MVAGVKFVAADMPEANETMVHFMSVMAQHEAISLRTKAALAAAKARGTKTQLIRSLENATDKLKSTKVTSCSCVLSTSEK